MGDPIDGSRARDTGLFLVAVVLVNGLLAAAISATPLLETFYLALFIHIGFTLYDGSFGAARTLTWLLLIGAWAVSELVAFLGLMLPWGQLQFWLASQLTDVPFVGETLVRWLFRGSSSSTQVGPLLEPMLLWLVFGLDVAVMHRDGWRGRSSLRVAFFVLAVVATAIVLGFAVGLVVRPSSTDAQSSATTPLHILPPWPTLPLYALLRALPMKLGGVILVFAAALVPMIWPWARADQLRKGSMRRVWQLLCLVLGAIWIGLGYLGSRPAEGVALVAAQGLAFLYFAFFLAAPLMLGRIAGR